MAKKYLPREDNPMILEMLKKRDYDALIEFCGKRGMVQEFIEVIYLENPPYKIGDNILCNVNKIEEVYGKIVDIATLLIGPIEPGHLPLVKIQKYQDKYQLKLGDLKLAKKDFDGMSELELFLIDEETWVFIDDVVWKIEMMTLQQYEDIPKKDKNGNQYFSRAMIHYGELITYDGWYRICTCQQLYNPDKDYVQCDKCDLWMHDKCAKIDINILQVNKDGFLCPICLDSQKKKQKKNMK